MPDMTTAQVLELPSDDFPLIIIIKPGGDPSNFADWVGVIGADAISHASGFARFGGQRPTADVAPHELVVGNSNIPVVIGGLRITPVYGNLEDPEEITSIDVTSDGEQPVTLFGQPIATVPPETV